MLQARTFLAWHYTTATRFLQILRQRVLMPRESCGASFGQPVIWFSVHDDFEPSACLTADRGNGRVERCSVSETAELGQGLVRLGVPIRTLLTCAELRREARMSDATWKQLCDDARELGSDPDQWFGGLHPIPLEQCVIDVRDDDGRWQRMQGPSSRADAPARMERTRAPHSIAAR
jgi:hypothetical protein